MTRAGPRGVAVWVGRWPLLAFGIAVLAGCSDDTRALASFGSGQGGASGYGQGGASGDGAAGATQDAAVSNGGGGGAGGGGGTGPAADPCASGPCLNGGSCGPGADGGFSCACPAGYAGLTCASNVDDCLPNPCLNGGSCQDGVAAATCTCRPAFTGRRCELPRFQPLGPTVPCDGPVIATAMSADGSTVAGTCGTHAAVRWTVADGFVDLGIPSATASDSIPIALNADGSALLIQFQRADGTAGVLRWDAGAGTRDVLLQPAGFSLIPTAASADLSVIVGRYYQPSVNPGFQPGFRYTTAQGLETLAVPAGSLYGCQDVGVSGDGAVLAGSCYDGAGALEATRWREPGADLAVELVDPPSSFYCRAISGDGNVLVGSLGIHELRFAGDGPSQDLGALPTAPVAFASAASADGSVIGGTAEYTGYPFAYYATIWDAANGLRAVADALAADGSDTSGWTLESVVAISADGKVIVGNGWNAGAQQRFWIARLY